MNNQANPPRPSYGNVAFHLVSSFLNSLMARESCRGNASTYNYFVLAAALVDLNLSFRGQRVTIASAEKRVNIIKVELFESRPGPCKKENCKIICS